MSISVPDFNLEQCKGLISVTEDDVYLCLWPMAPNTSPPILPRLTTDMVLVVFDLVWTLFQTPCRNNIAEGYSNCPLNIWKMKYFHPPEARCLQHNSNVNVEVVQNRKWTGGDCFAQHGPSWAKGSSAYYLHCLSAYRWVFLVFRPKND